MLAELNKELQRQGLPTVTENIYHYRMAQATPPLIRQLKAGGNEPAENQGSTEAPVSFPRSASPEGGHVVLPPIRNQPNLAQHLGQIATVTGQDLPVEEDRDQAGQSRDL